jgi:hypothetical protein
MKTLASTYLKMLLGMVFGTREEELVCDECFDQVQTFAEMVFAGKDAANAMPLVQAHLDGCMECHEEFEALLTVLRAQSN